MSSSLRLIGGSLSSQAGSTSTWHVPHIAAPPHSPMIPSVWASRAARMIDVPAGTSRRTWPPLGRVMWTVGMSGRHQFHGQAVHRPQGVVQVTLVGTSELDLLDS